MKYSPSFKGFYVQGLSPNIPDDAVEVTDSDYKKLFEDQKKGAVIIPNHEGYPIAMFATTVVVNEDKLAKAKRDVLLAGTDWTQLSDVDSSVKDKYVAYRQALRDITLQPTYPSNVEWPLKPE